LEQEDSNPSNKTNAHAPDTFEIVINVLA